MVIKLYLNIQLKFDKNYLINYEMKIFELNVIYKRYFKIL